MASSTHYIRPIIRTYCDPRLEELDLEIDGLTDAELIEAKRKAAVERERRLYYQGSQEEYGFGGSDD